MRQLLKKLYLCLLDVANCVGPNHYYYYTKFVKLLRVLLFHILYVYILSC